MKAFLYHTLKLTVILITILLFSLFYIPDKEIKSSLLAIYPQKNILLNSIKQPKIILLGGSNVSFGLDSKTLIKTFHKPVMNMGVNAGVGLQFIINDVKSSIKKGDTIILIPEYEHFYKETYYGEMELISILFDIEPKAKQNIDFKNWTHLLKYLPTYSAKKIKNYIPSLLSKKSNVVTIYHKNSFNIFGDAYIHWSLPNQDYEHSIKNNLNEKINPDVIQCLKNFKAFAHQKGATVLLFPPVIDSTSFNNQKMIIIKIAQDLKNNDIAFVSNPNTYCYKNNLFFNSYYHLNKTGVDKRTQQLITDLIRLKSE